MTPKEIKALRHAARMTQSEWAAAIGINIATVQRYEARKGLPYASKVPAPTLKLMQHLAKRAELLKK